MKITHQIYKDYPEQPYISADRDMKSWEKSPELFPYDIVPKSHMERLPEGVLPGDIIMLWRINFGNFTNKSVIPQYFEYRYGVNSDECFETLIRLGFVDICNSNKSLDALNSDFLKKMLSANGLETKGKKDELLRRVSENIPEQELSKLFDLRKYKITTTGESLLLKYGNIIKKHGPKM